MKVSVTISGFTRLFGGDLGRVVDAASAADDSGIDELVVADHVVMGSRTDRYPFGTFPYPPDEPWPEPLALLAALAGVTSRSRLATGIVISPLRPAVLLAKQCATVDQLSGGRLHLGVGLGWQREEYEACGVDWERRGQVFDDQLAALRLLWTGDPPVEMRAATISFGPTWCEPRPAQTGGIPLGFGMAATPENVERIAEFGSAWLPIYTTSPDELSTGVGRIRAAFVARGRDPEDLEVRAAARAVFDVTGRLDGSATVDEAERLARLGVSVAGYGLGRNLEGPADVGRFLSDLGAAFDRS